MQLSRCAKTIDDIFERMVWSMRAFYMLFVRMFDNFIFFHGIKRPLTRCFVKNMSSVIQQFGLDLSSIAYSAYVTLFMSSSLSMLYSIIYFNFMASIINMTLYMCVHHWFSFHIEGLLCVVYLPISIFMLFHGNLFVIQSKDTIQIEMDVLFLEFRQFSAELSSPPFSDSYIHYGN